MATSVPKAILAAAILCAAGCSSAKAPPPPSRPPVLGRAATLEFPTNIQVAAVAAMPAGFAPIADRPPMWLRGGAELGVVGSQNGHTVVYGLSGAGWKTGRVLAAETGPEAAVPGTIVDVAASPDGMTLAIAVASADGGHLDIVLRDLIATGKGRPIETFDGRFDSVSISWLNSATIAVGLRRHPEPPAAVNFGRRNGDTDTEPPEPPPANGLQLLVVSGASFVMPLKLDCPMSQLSWSPHGEFAVAQGDQGAPPILIDRVRPACVPFHIHTPIRVLDWSGADEGSFLYLSPDGTGRTVGLYEYNIATGAEHPMGISTGAADFTTSGSVLVLGNHNISYKLAGEQPDRLLLAEVALSNPNHSEVDIRPLGFDSTPAMFAHSSMSYSGASDQAAMQVFAPSIPVPWRKIVEYSLVSSSSYLLAAGPARGIVTMSWSPKGRWLAILDGDAAIGTALAVLAPPR